MAKRNKLNLIYGQPLLLETPRTSSRSTKVTPIVAPPGPAHPPPKPKPRHSTISNGLEGQHAVPERSGSGSMSIPKLSTKPQPRPPPGPHLHTPSPKAGGSKELPRLGKSRKRSLSPPRPSSSKKRIKESQALCVICGQAPHLVHDCPVVKKGSKRYGDFTGS